MQESGKAGDDEEARDFVEFIKRKSGLMIERADKRFAFVHLSFQEYFAAYYLQQQLTAAFFGEDVAAEVSPDAVKAYVDQDVRRETLVFLFELCAAQPALSKRLHETIFGKFQCTRLSDLSKFPELLKLKHLNLNDTQVSDLSKWPNLPKLKLLQLSRTQVTKEHVQKFKESHPQCQVDGWGISETNSE